MVAIDMEMPTSCKKCMLNNIDSPWFGLCRTTGNNVIEYKDSRHPNCPLVEIITCKNCKHRWKVKDDYGYEGRTFCECTDQVVDDDGFCSKGERKK